jgi:4-hydroxybenzoate polyprenyltransferase
MIEAVKQLFWSSRPVSWINTAYPFAVAYLFVAHTFDIHLLVGTLFFLGPYNLLMYGINDVFDYESDLRNPRKGGIEGALLAPKWHRLTIWAAVLSSAPFVLHLYVYGNLESSAWLTLILFTVVAYSAKGLRFKEKPFLDSITSSSHFVGPMIIGLTFAGADLAEPKLLMMILAFTLWGVASHAFGAVQDVQADREGSINSIATVIGARATVRFAFAAYALSGVLMLFAGWPAALAAIAAVPYLFIVGPFWNITDETCELANKGWRKFIWLNFFAGAVVSMVIIWSAIELGFFG